ncbi:MULTISPECIES: SMI1/KNR4 family protein [Burkholderia cepacia complex]|nr:MULTISPECIES: SMI1/KNR4 family protein [Burkholderia cepacia complex]MCA8131675.1 SMI1/KNR4 family protein [Burkholderia cepacia]MDN7614213.1 SMI1/KNR4 family protein [Burkholderia cepacia]MDN7635018.1 SMI1/KNR4 family protein [Burkholderia cepacia]UOB59693.1 SMI1/KNR4 family protein [Burkholderia pyrrocinia]HEM7889322.1 SMI1/KNR4 family protein [Burkholderia cepacia]
MLRDRKVTFEGGAMEVGKFANCASGISVVDFENVEKDLGYTLPVAFRVQYLASNGGNPVNALFKNEDCGEPLEVVGFYPIKYNTSAYETKDSLLLEHYRVMFGRGVIPANLLPFAHDPGGNFFCIDMSDGEVVFYATDALDPDLSAEENHAAVQIVLASSFESFMNQLSGDANFDSSEWPED